MPASTQSDIAFYTFNKVHLRCKTISSRSSYKNATSFLVHYVPGIYCLVVSSIEVVSPRNYIEASEGASGGPVAKIDAMSFQLC